MSRSYSELIRLPTFEERYLYLRLGNVVGATTFGFERIFNQRFYNSKQWKSFRDQVILRDNGCDLGVEGYELRGRILIHHMNPITMEDIERQSEQLLNPEFLICVSHATHQAIHYGDADQLPKAPTERRKNDTCPWRQ